MMDLGQRVSNGVLLSFLGSLAAFGQAGNPGAVQDAEMERRAILKAADQIEIMVHRMEKMQKEMTETQRRLDALEEADTALKAQVKSSEERQAKQQAALLDEVSKLLAEGQTTASSAEVATEQEGYEHIVRKGENVWAIAKAFRAQGVDVTADDILEANDLGEDDFLQIGQKLFIPKPNG